jgi:GTPase SAR1 family protein
MLVGNKHDLQSQREVAFEDGENLANEYHFTFCETSAHSSYNVDRAFLQLASQIKHQMVEEQIKSLRDVDNLADLEKQQQQRQAKASCC